MEKPLSSPTLAVVILHYGAPALTQRLLSQLRASDPELGQRVLVLDNHAPEPFPDAWRRLDRNLYWGGALAYCLQACRELGCSHLWYLNNDIAFISRPPHLERAWQRLQRLDARLGPVGVYSPSVLRNPYHAQMVQRPEGQFRLVPYIDGIAPLFRLECLDALGGLDLGANPYGYGVDVWTSLAAHRAGWPVVVDHQVALRHSYHSTARRVEGFLALAGAAQDAYLEERLGPGYAAELQRLQGAYEEGEEM